MRLVFKTANPSTAVHARLCGLAVAIALLLSQPLRAQTLPASDAASEPESLASTETHGSSESATRPESLPASLPAPATAAAVSSPESWWQINQSMLAAGVLCSAGGPAMALVAVTLPVGWAIGTTIALFVFAPCSGLAPMLVAAAPFVLGLIGMWSTFIAILPPLNALLAPLAIGYGAALDSARTGRAWWPAALGAAAGGLIALAAAVGGGVVGFAVPPSYFIYSGQGLGRIIFAGLVAYLFTQLIPPAALGGALLADLLLQPKTDAPARSAAIIGDE